MIKNIFLIFLLSSLCSSCNRISTLYVLFGEAKTKHAEAGDTVLRLYFDYEGTIYPDAQISDIILREDSSFLRRFYLNHKDSLYRISVLEGIAKPDTANSLKTIDQLQNQLVEKCTDIINKRSGDKKVVFLIHGYNKHATKPENRNSFAEFKTARDKLETQFGKNTFFFVEIYWDGLSSKNGNGLALLNSPKIWDNAQAGSTWVGLELRRVIAKIDREKLYIITHSHGASVVTNALFNVRRFKPRYYKEDRYGKLIDSMFSTKMYNTPKQTIYVGMLAPAIPGENVFDEYYDRTIDGKKDMGPSNLHFLLGFNHFDSVTRKFILSSKIGSTTLACNYSELHRTIVLMNSRELLLDYVDFSRTVENDKLKKQTTHGFPFYINNQPNAQLFFDRLFNH